MQDPKPGHLTICGLLLSTVAAAQAPPAPAGTPISTLIPAEPTKRQAPDYPSRALSKSREGWAIASFVVSEDGTVIEPMIESSSHPDFDAPTLRAIRQWRYKPAMRDGKPVEQSMVQTVVRYNLGRVTGARPEFIAQYRRTSELLKAKDLVAAAAAIEALDEGELNLYEDAWLAWLRAVYLEDSGNTDSRKLMEMLQRALGGTDTSGYSSLAPDMFVLASQRLTTLRMLDGDLSGALTTLEGLDRSEVGQRSPLYEKAVASLAPLRAEIARVLAQPSPLQNVGRIESNGYWVHRLLRRSFAFGDVPGGALELVDLRCTGATRRFSPMPDAILAIPETWGDCRLYMKGDEGTTFAFEEYAPSTANAAPAAPR